jgi:hypothetical protein
MLDALPLTRAQRDMSQASKRKYLLYAKTCSGYKYMSVPLLHFYLENHTSIDSHLGNFDTNRTLRYRIQISSNSTEPTL